VTVFLYGAVYGGASIYSLIRSPAVEFDSLHPLQ
jgi:hypothetical protein